MNSDLAAYTAKHLQITQKRMEGKEVLAIDASYAEKYIL